MTKIEFKLIPDPDVFTFFEESTSGGISYISNRYSKVNNKYLKSHDLKQKIKVYYTLRHK